MTRSLLVGLATDCVGLLTGHHTRTRCGQQPRQPRRRLGAKMGRYATCGRANASGQHRGRACTVRLESASTPRRISLVFQHYFWLTNALPARSQPSFPLQASITAHVSTPGHFCLNRFQVTKMSQFMLESPYIPQIVRLCFIVVSSYEVRTSDDAYIATLLPYTVHLYDGDV